MKLSEPIGNNMWAGFFVRLALGGYLIGAGLTTLDNLAAFIQEIQKLNLFPGHLATLYAISLPYLEVACGALLVVGIWTTAAAIIAAAVLGSFVFAFGVFPAHNKLLFNKDIILLAAAVSLMFSGAGALSLDKFRKTS